MQLSPARGRLRKVAVVADKILRCSLSPRGDGYCLTAGIVHRQKDAAYLREGTVTHSALRMRCPCRCSLAPRGDGYSLCHVKTPFDLKMQLSPARGRLRGFQRVNLLVTHGCSLAPRGDGYKGSNGKSSRVTMQLIPARGRLLMFRGVNPHAQKDAAYPREGTVTTGTSQPFPPCRMQLIPARGRLLTCSSH